MTMDNPDLTESENYAQGFTMAERHFKQLLRQRLDELKNKWCDSFGNSYTKDLVAYRKVEEIIGGLCK